jgi:hypothetical protein
MRRRHIDEDDVWTILALHDVDRPGDAPQKRELIGDAGLRRLLVVVEPAAQEVRVITVYPVEWDYARRPRLRRDLRDPS